MALVERAAKAGFDTLLVTVDVPVAGARLRDVRNGMTIPPTLTPRTVVNAIPRPAWWFNFLTTEPLAFASLDAWSGTVAELLDTMFDPTVTYEDLAWIKEQWPGKLVGQGRADRRRRGAAGRRRRRRDHPVATTAAASSTARRCRSTCCPRWSKEVGSRPRGAPRHRHHVRPGHRRRDRARRPVHAGRPRVPLRPDGRRPPRRRPHHRDPRRVRSSAPCGCSASGRSTSWSPRTSLLSAGSAELALVLPADPGGRPSGCYSPVRPVASSTATSRCPGMSRVLHEVARVRAGSRSDNGAEPMRPWRRMWRHGWAPARLKRKG